MITQVSAQRPKVYLGFHAGMGASLWNYNGINYSAETYNFDTRIAVYQARMFYGFDVSLMGTPYLQLDDKIVRTMDGVLKLKLGVLPIKRQHFKMHLGAGVNLATRLTNDPLKAYNESTRGTEGQLEVFTDFVVHGFNIGLRVQFPFGNRDVNLVRGSVAAITFGYWF